VTFPCYGINHLKVTVVLLLRSLISVFNVASNPALACPVLKMLRFYSSAHQPGRYELPGLECPVQNIFSALLQHLIYSFLRVFRTDFVHFQLHPLPRILSPLKFSVIVRDLLRLATQFDTAESSVKFCDNMEVHKLWELLHKSACKYCEHQGAPKSPTCYPNLRPNGPHLGAELLKTKPSPSH
jgi:hypothetical protein